MVRLATAVRSVAVAVARLVIALMVLMCSSAWYDVGSVEA